MRLSTSAAKLPAAENVRRPISRRSLPGRLMRGCRSAEISPQYVVLFPPPFRRMSITIRRTRRFRDIRIELPRNEAGVGRRVVGDVQRAAAVDPRQSVLDVPQPQVERLAAGARGGFPPASEQADVLLHGDRLEPHVAPSAARELERERRRDPEAAQHLGADHEVGDSVEDGPLVVPRDQRADAVLHLLGGDAADRRNPGADERSVFCLGDEAALPGTGTAGADRRSGAGPGSG